MRELGGEKRFTKVLVGDEPGPGGACHEYYICNVDGSEHEVAGEFGAIRFQNGPIKENGVNGCHQKDLLAIVIDRLEGFQSGAFACEENAIALSCVKAALHMLNVRTKKRINRGVEGTSKI